MKLAALMGLHLLWGLVLWFNISKLGPGASTDSVHLLFAGLNLSEGHGLVSFDGSPVLGWPPLYPILLGAIHLGTRLDMLGAATLLQVIAFLGLSFCLSILFLKIFPDNLLLAATACILSDVGVVMVAGFAMVGSDYVHLFLAVLYMLLLGYYIQQGDKRVFIALALVGILTTMQRYLGIAAIFTGMIGVLFWGHGNLGQRGLRALFLSFSALPAGLWLLLTSPVVGRRAPITFDENFQWFSKSVLEWFLPGEAVRAHLTLYTVLLWGFLLGLVPALLLPQRKAFRTFAMPILLYGLCHLVALFGSASITYFNKLGGRFILPLYIPLVTLLTLAASAALQAAKGHADLRTRGIVPTGVYGVLAALVLALLGVTLPFIQASHAGVATGENAFNTAEWHANRILRFWSNNPPQGEYLLFSNYPDGVAFFTGHACYTSPRRYSGPYGKVEFPVSQYSSELFAAGQDVYLIWIEPNEFGYYYEPSDLQAIADVEPIRVNGDSGIYRLRPKARK